MIVKTIYAKTCGSLSKSYRCKTHQLFIKMIFYFKTNCKGRRDRGGLHKMCSLGVYYGQGSNIFVQIVLKTGNLSTHKAFSAKFWQNYILYKYHDCSWNTSVSSCHVYYTPRWALRLSGSVHRFMESLKQTVTSNMRHHITECHY